MGIAHELPELTDKIEIMASKAARISDLIYIPLQASHQTDIFKEFVEGLTDQEIHALNEQWSDFSQIYDIDDDHQINEFAQEIAIDLCLHCPFAYLVKIETTQSVYGGELKDGELKEFSYSWGSYSMEWRFAHDMNHAVDQAIELGKLNLQKHGKLLATKK